MKMMKNRAIELILLLLTMTTLAQGQEMLVNLHSNAILRGSAEMLGRNQDASRAVGDTLSLPFFDDFSEPFSRMAQWNDVYPNADLWIDNKVYINNHMAINPISQGVATFDGLDEHGLAYGFGFSLPSESDSLTSKPIDLSSAIDTVYLSFFYQPQGMGNAPEVEDSLVLEFKDTASEWRSVWAAEGHILENYDFTRAMVPVLGPQYLYNGFQFRFRNYASLAGSVDHWNLDYVELDDGRTLADTLINDISFMGQTSNSHSGSLVNQTGSLLREYASMPWTHFLTGDTNIFMIDTLHFVIRNNTQLTKRVRFVYSVYDYTNALRYASTQTGTDVFPGIVCGSEMNDCNDDQSANFRTDLNNFYFPHDSQISPDSSYFLVEYRIDSIFDAVADNDMSVFKQEFYNYYAYDDGTAEIAYGLGNLDSPGMVAMKYDIKMRDTLRSIQIYLNPVDNDISQQPVNLAVWTGNDQPETLIWMSADTSLSYSGRINAFYHYMLDTPLDVEGTIFVGWIQQPATGIKFSVGFDRRNDVSDKLFYNLGTNWSQSSLPGAVMIRPTFGRSYQWAAGVQEQQMETLHIYPNPTSGILHLLEKYPGQFKDAQISIYDLAGRTVFNEKGYHGLIDVSNLAAGTYVLSAGQRLVQRIVVQP